SALLCRGLGVVYKRQTDRLQAGTVWVNSHTLIDANLPFGGMKQTGTGPDFGPDWLDGWCETKWVCVRY
ncbi:aldehyde dehydrogenase family protein, partial [Enterobacter hormaechei]